jgi:hypothetical protein
MEAQRLLEFVQDVLIIIHQNIAEVQNRKQFADPQELDYIEAKLQTYREVLATFKFSAREFGLPEEQLGV